MPGSLAQRNAAMSGLPSSGVQQSGRCPTMASPRPPVRHNPPRRGRPTPARSRLPDDAAAAAPASPAAAAISALPPPPAPPNAAEQSLYVLPLPAPEQESSCSPGAQANTIRPKPRSRAIGRALDPLFLGELRSFVEVCKSYPALLANPSLAFFRDYLKSSGAGASAKPPPATTSNRQRMGAGKKGVRREASGRYSAHVKDGRKQRHVGTFNSIEEAVAVREEVARKHMLKIKNQCSFKAKRQKHQFFGKLKAKFGEIDDDEVVKSVENLNKLVPRTLEEFAKRVVSAQENSSAAEESTAESPEEEKRPLQKATCRLIKEKEDGQDMISSLKEEMNRLLEQQHDQFEIKTKQMEEQLATYQQKSQLWNKKENIFHNYMNSQQLYVKGLNTSLRSIQSDIYAFQMKWRDEISNLGSNLKCLVDAAENYPKVLAENQNLFNEVQELKGNIRVYCRVRPFLPGEDKKSTIIDYIGESGELLISNPLKQGKAGQRMFTFNKVFSSFASQADVFSDTQPLIRSVLDGFNVCILAYGQTGSGKTYTMSGTSTSKKDQGVTYRALNDLFDISLNRRNIFSYEVGVQMVEIYNEQVRDLLSNKIEQKRIGILSTSQPNGLVLPDVSLYPVKSTSDVLDLMETGLGNRAVGATALNEKSSRSHSILTVHVRGLDLKTGSISRGCLHLVDLAGSERVERSKAMGDRLKEAQHINKSLSALGDVIFALAQKSTHVPYRNSKLTQLLKSSLGGQAKTLMFVQINPNVESYSETISTLKFAERVSGVELGAAGSNKDGKDIKELLEQVSSLKDTISRKDMVIEELQLRKDKNKSPSSVVDNHGSSMPNNDAGQTSPTNIVAMGLDEADYEDNVSEDGSLVRETKYTIGRRNIMNCDIIDDTKMHRGPSRIDRSTLTKSTQPAISRSKPRGAVLKTPKSHKDPIQPVGGRLFGQGNQKMAEIEHVPAARSVFCMPTATRRDVKGGNSWGVAVG